MYWVMFAKNWNIKMYVNSPAGNKVRSEVIEKNNVTTIEREKLKNIPVVIRNLEVFQELVRR
jgi:hypothetical protein